jgi:diguanylate cyclase (GGDEF)-like protein/PAS domain S-box-containing protein
MASVRRPGALLPNRTILLLGLAIATVPAITAGLAAEVLWLARPDAAPALAGPARAMPLVALPLAALLLGMAALHLTGRARQVRELREQAGRVGGTLEAIIDAAGDGIVLLDPTGIVRDWNPAAAALYGVTADEALGRPFASLVHEADVVASQAALCRVAATGARERTTTGHRRRDDGAFFAITTWSAVRDPDGSIAAISLTIRDATAETVTTAKLEASERRARLLAESAIEAVISADDTGRVIGWNPAAARLLGLDEREGQGLTIDDLLVVPEGGVSGTWRGLAGHSGRVVARRRDGAAFEADLSVATYEDDGRTWYTAFVRDVTERVQAEERARESEARYRDLVERLPGVVYRARVGRWAPTDYMSPQLMPMLGFSPDEWVGVPGRWEQQIHPDDLQRVLAEDDGEVRGPAAEPRAAREYRMLARDGREIWVRDHAVLDRDPDGTPIAWHGFLTDVTERKRLESELVRLAFHDPLTGLVNRALLNDRLRGAMSRLDPEDGLVAMLLIDIDDFKRVNDAHGHEVGDQLLVAVAARLRETIRPGITIARLGGDEFAVLVEHLGEEAGALAIAQRVVTAFDRPFRVEGITLSARASVGVAVDIARKRSPAWLLRSADLAMYEAKRLGKGRWQVYDPVAHLASARRLVLESELRRAVERNQFALVYQPVRDLRSGEIVGSEALLRWNHPTRGVIGPAEFIPALESTGLIVGVGRWVVDEACRQAAVWASQVPSLRWTAVNVSAAQLRGDSIVGSIRESIARHGLEASRLSVEVTESLALDDSRDTGELLRRVRDLGVRIAVDDFGTGYSSLSYLRRLPIDRLKIDRSFVEGVAIDPEATAVARVIVELARSLHLTTVAEGIEDASQARVLAEMGCDMGQGYLFARPMQPAALGTLVAARASLRERLPARGPGTSGAGKVPG